jgi:hypothetical protein
MRRVGTRLFREDDLDIQGIPKVLDDSAPLGDV